MRSESPDFIAIGPGDPTLGDDLRALFRVFSERRRLIAAIMAASLLLALAALWVIPPAYTSSVDIFIDPRERNIVNLGVAPTGLGSSSQGADAALLESQVAILQSRLVLGALIDQEKLENDPAFNGQADGLRASLLAVLKTLVYGPNAENFTQATPFDRALAKLQRAIKVTRVTQTYVVNISVTTGSAAQSARLANALAEIYIAQGQAAVDDKAREAARSLEARLAELRQASERSQKAVEDYRKQNGLLGAQGARFDERQITELSAQVVGASVAAETARVAVDNLRRSKADAVTSEIATRLRLQLEQALAQEQASARIYGDRHPNLAAIRDTRMSLQRALDVEVARVLARAQSDLQAAKKREASLKAMLAQAEERLARSNSASVKLRELEQLADQDRGLYDAFATKAKQAREQISLPTTTARIISVAEPASIPSAPRAPVILGVALFLGAILGFGAAWLSHIFADAPAAIAKRRLMADMPRVAGE